jgi:RNA polymerase sigma-70 factor (ECF subfamily)
MPRVDELPLNASGLTLLMNRSADGDVEATQALWNILQSEVRLLAERLVRRETRIPDLQTTMLFNDLWLEHFQQLHKEELAGDDLPPGETGEAPVWHNRRHFWAAVVKKARCILTDKYRHAHAAKRGGGWTRRPLDVVAGELGDMSRIPEYDIPALHDALDRLRTEEPRTADVVELRFFFGLTVKETAANLGISRRTVDNDWAFGRAWLRAALHDPAASPS